MKTNNKAAYAALGLCAALLGGTAHADVFVDNGVVTATGTHVTYTFGLADMGLFGPVSGVSITGDTLNFAPTAFGGTSFNIMAESLIINVSFKAGYDNYEFTRFDLSESGRFVKAGAHRDADATFTVRDTYLPNTHVETLVLDKVVDGANWTISGSVVPSAEWGAGGLFNSATLNLSNSLAAFGGAEVWKDVVRISAHVAPIPEAETYAMMLVGLGLVGFMARRRRAQQVEAGQRG